MRQRSRKFLGTIVIVSFVIVYALVAMALAESRIREAHQAIQAVAYVVLGILWIFPVMPLIRWMQKPDPDGP